MSPTSSKAANTAMEREAARTAAKVLFITCRNKIRLSLIYIISTFMNLLVSQTCTYYVIL